MPTLSASRPAPATGKVIALNAPQHRQPPQQRLAQHADLFCNRRQRPDDVFWLKENAEFLNILEATGHAGKADAVCDTYAEVYDQIDTRLAEHPQYYRFFLSIALDYEDLALRGDKAARMCNWVRRRNLPGAELSDLQRAEARRLLARRGCAAADPALTMRLHQFIARPETFAIPNRKAAYELTHIVFYLSEYGRLDPGLSDMALRSLRYCGLLAYLDQNMDLLAEVCIALRYAGQRPSSIWEGAVQAALKSVMVSAVDLGGGFALAPDNYHDYLVCTWSARMAGGAAMPAILPSGSAARLDFVQPVDRPLEALTEALAENSTDNWGTAQFGVRAHMQDSGLRLLDAAEASVPDFGAFYRIFARAARV